MKIKDYFEDYLNYLYLEGRSPKTIREHRRFLYGAVVHSPVADKRINHLKLTDVAYLIESGKMHGEFGSQRAVSVFRCYLHYLHDKGIKLPLDYRDIQVPRSPYKEGVYYTKEELEKIFNAIMTKGTATYFCRLRLRALLEVLFASGMRISEALSLTKEQFYKEIKPRKEAIIKGKGGDQRVVYFTDRSIKWIEKYLAARKDNSPALFVSMKGTPLKVVTAKSDLMRHRKEWGIDKRVHFHAFRRSLATYLIEHGADIKTTQIVLGHKSERTTLKYYVIANKQRAKDVYHQLLDN